MIHKLNIHHLTNFQNPFEHLRFIGAINGKWNELEELIKSQPDEQVYFQLGDFGLGAQGYQKAMQSLSELLEQKGSGMILARGDTDHPSMFLEAEKHNQDNVKLIPDASGIVAEGKTLQISGGGVHPMQTLFNKDEQQQASNRANIPFEPDEVDIFISHMSPVAPPSKTLPESYLQTLDTAILTAIEETRKVAELQFSNSDASLCVCAHCEEEFLVMSKEGKFVKGLAELEIW